MARATLWEDEDVYVFHDSDGHDSEKDLKKKKSGLRQRHFPNCSIRTKNGFVIADAGKLDAT